jgi:hypothetical protein
MPTCRIHNALLPVPALLLCRISPGRAAEGSPELQKSSGFEEVDGDLLRGWSLSVGARIACSAKSKEVRVEAAGASEGHALLLRGANDTSV